MGKSDLEKRDDNKPKICFISLEAYPLLACRDISVVGGAQLQQVLLARELVDRGFDVSFVVFDHGQNSPQIIDGIKVFKAYPSDSRKASAFSKVRSLWRALSEANADIYCLRTGPFGIVTLYRSLARKRVVYAVAADAIASGDKIEGTHGFALWLRNFDLRRADRIVVQNEYQQAAVRAKFRRDSVLIKSLLPPLKENSAKSKLPIVIWVGNIWSPKQPELFLELAKSLPDASFQMIGRPPSDERANKQFTQAVRQIANLEFLGFVPHYRIDSYFAQASVLVNTSSIEGFPNTFLEAWASHTPVVSLNIDPDEVICKYRLGLHSRAFAQMVKDVKLLLEDRKLREEMGVNARKYIEKAHDIGQIVNQYRALFRELSITKGAIDCTRGS